MKLKRHFFSIIAMTFFVALAFGSGDSSDDDLKATVSFTGTQFIINNNDDFDYDDAELELNGKYTLKGYTLKAHQSYTVGMVQFSDEEGNRFNLMQKPKKFRITCKKPNGNTGFYFASWND